MRQRYPATYTDAHSRETTVITNDGETLRMELRGVMFTAADFDGFEPDDAAPPESLATFTLNGRELCACTLAFDMPIPFTIMARHPPPRSWLHLPTATPKPMAQLITSTSQSR